MDRGVEQHSPYCRPSNLNYHTANVDTIERILAHMAARPIALCLKAFLLGGEVSSQFVYDHAPSR
jgi:hypothetical protein